MSCVAAGNQQDPVFLFRFRVSQRHVIILATTQLLYSISPGITPRGLPRRKHSRPSFIIVKHRAPAYPRLLARLTQHNQLLSSSSLSLLLPLLPLTTATYLSFIGSSSFSSFPRWKRCLSTRPSSSRRGHGLDILRRPSHLPMLSPSRRRCWCPLPRTRNADSVKSIYVRVLSTLQADRSVDHVGTTRPRGRCEMSWDPEKDANRAVRRT